MKTTPLVARAKWDEMENSEPQTHTVMSPTGQWSLMAAYWILGSVWAVVAVVYKCEKGSVVWWIIISFPLVLLASTVFPLAMALIGYKPPWTAWVGIALQLFIPICLVKAGLVLPYFIGLSGFVIYMFMFQSIHQAGMVNMGPAFYMFWVLGAPCILGVLNAYLYEWNKNGGFFGWPLSPSWVTSIRFVILPLYAGLKEVIPALIKEAMGKTPPYNSEEFRTYKLNDVQYIRLNHIRSAMFLCLMAYNRVLETLICPLPE